jgi:hypothetical protein
VWYDAARSAGFEPLEVLMTVWSMGAESEAPGWEPEPLPLEIHLPGTPPTRDESHDPDRADERGRVIVIELA